MSSEGTKPDIERLPPTLNYAGPEPRYSRDGEYRLSFEMSVPTVLLFLALIGGAIYILHPALSSSHPNSRSACMSNLHQLGLALTNYASEHQGQLPSALEPLIVERYIDVRTLICPETNDSAAVGSSPEERARQLSALGRPENYASATTRPTLHLSYVYCGAGLRMPASDEAILAYEPISDHGNLMNVLYANTHVAGESKPTALKIISELQAGYNPPRPEKIR